MNVVLVSLHFGPSTLIYHLLRSQGLPAGT